jgi:hypothetical protein
VATIFIARWEGQLDMERARRMLAGDEVLAPAELQA